MSEARHDIGQAVEGPISLLPVRSFAEVWHVGTMKAVDKREISLEGSGLSMSLHPSMWRYLDGGWIRGDLWRLTRDENRFLDLVHMDDSQREVLTNWGVQNGYVSKSTGLLWGDR